MLIAFVSFCFRTGSRHFASESHLLAALRRVIISGGGRKCNCVPPPHGNARPSFCLSGTPFFPAGAPHEGRRRGGDVAVPGRAVPGSCPWCRARCQLAPEDAGGDQPTCPSCTAREGLGTATPALLGRSGGPGGRGVTLAVGSAGGLVGSALLPPAAVPARAALPSPSRCSRRDGAPWGCSGNRRREGSLLKIALPKRLWL